MSWHLGRMGFVGGCLACLALGCQKTATSAPAAKILALPVSVPVSHVITDFEEFSGRTEAVATIDLRARVTGYLDRIHFKEGSEVREGDLLFEIDPRPYRAELDRVEANVAQMEVRSNRLDADLRRAKNLRPTSAISQEDYDRIEGDWSEAQAAVKSAIAAREVARLNLSFTKVRAPISGRISQTNIDPGNLIRADDTLLTSIVSQDPIRAYFDVDERTVLRLRRLQIEGKLSQAGDVGVPVQVSLADENDFVHAGTIDFADNKVDPNTGTRRLRGVIPNKDRLLSPGMFVRVRLPIGVPYRAILIAEQALGSDQGQKYVFVANENNEIEYRRVRLGAQHEGLRVIEQGLKDTDRVLISGLQRVRPGAKIEPKLTPMPAPHMERSTPPA